MCEFSRHRAVTGTKFFTDAMINFPTRMYIYIYIYIYTYIYIYICTYIYIFFPSFVISVPMYWTFDLLAEYRQFSIFAICQ